MAEVSDKTVIAVIGGGRIGGTLLRAAARFAPHLPLVLATRDPKAAATLAAEVPGLTLASPDEAAARADLLMLAIPPEAYLPVLGAIGARMRPSAILVSLTNGVPLETIGQRIANPVVKVIPTMAHIVGRGVALVTPGPRAGAGEVERVREVFSTFSRPQIVDEADIRAASNVAGSGLALIAGWCDAFVAANAARTPGLDRDALAVMLAETLGAVSDLVREGHAFSEIVERTATPGGMTAAALEILRAAPIDAAVEETFRRQAGMRGAFDGGARG